MLGCPDLQGCVWRRPTKESLLYCNVPPKHDTEIRDLEKQCGLLLLYIKKSSKKKYFNILITFTCFSYLVWLWSNFLFKPLEDFVVFSLMHSHLLQVCLCQGFKIGREACLLVILMNIHVL